MHPEINPHASIQENIRIIKQLDGKEGISSPEESKAAKEYLLFAKPQNTADGIRLYELRQAVNNYDTIGESGFLLHCAKKAYHALKDYFKPEEDSAGNINNDNNIAKK